MGQCEQNGGDDENLMGFMKYFDRTINHKCFDGGRTRQFLRILHTSHTPLTRNATRLEI